MTLTDCPSCGRRELRGARSIHSFATRGGNALAITCRGCGAELAVATNQVLRPAAVEAVDAVA